MLAGKTALAPLRESRMGCEATKLPYHPAQTLVVRTSGYNDRTELVERILHTQTDRTMAQTSHLPKRCSHQATPRDRRLDSDSRSPDLASGKQVGRKAWGSRQTR